MIMRSFRSRVTAVGVVTLAVVFGFGSWVTVKALEEGARRDITAQNADVLDAVAEQIFAGTSPERVELPVAQDGTEFVIYNSDDQPVNLSVSFVGETVLLSEKELAAVLESTNPVLDGRLPVDVIGELPPFEVSHLALPVSAQSPDNFLQTSQQVETRSGDIFTLTAATPLQTVTRGISRLAIAFTVVVPVLVLLGGLALWFALGAVLKPVQRISEEALRIAPSNSGRRLPVPSSGDEIATMTKTLNGMLDRLDVGLVRQQQFVSDASHELRSPLTAVRASAELAALDVGLAEETAASLARVRRGVDRLEVVLDDLTQLAVGGESPMTKTDIDVVLLDAVEALSPSREVRIRTDGVQQIAALAHPVRLSRAIRNVLDNAMRHATTLIVVEARVEQGSVVITIDDDGPGVPSADQERIFERFVRLDEGRTRADGGSGLGLALVAAIMREHGGRALCDDRCGGGAQITLRFPA